MAIGIQRPAGEVFLDARGSGRAMRLSWHHETDLVVLSLWRDGMCAGTFRLAKDDVGDFVDALVDGLRDAPGVQLSAPALQQPSPAMPVTGAVERDATTHYRDEVQPSEAPGFTDWAFGDSSATAS